jgi:hypothetical protein
LQLALLFTQSLGSQQPAAAAAASSSNNIMEEDQWFFFSPLWLLPIFPSDAAVL